MMNSDCDVAVLTAPGRGGIASIGVRGRGAAAVVAEQFRPSGGVPVPELPEWKPVFGHWANGEQLVVCRHEPDAFELHCHGGPAVIRSLIDTLVARGCRPVEGGRWMSRRLGPIRAAAQAALVQAPSRRTAGILLDQYRGVLEAELHSAIDAIARRDPDASREALESLRRSASVGRHLTVPWTVAFLGDPNVGKSSLVNAILGFERSIVFHEPGTTRDVLTENTVLDGWPVSLVDTAGLRAPSDAIEQSGIQSAERVSRAADLVVLVFDLTRPWSPADRRRVDQSPSHLIVHNKSDQPVAVPTDRPPGVSTSAVTGGGVDALLASISRKLVPAPPAPGSGVLFTTGQVASVEAALAALDALRADDAVAIIERLLAEG